MSEGVSEPDAHSAELLHFPQAPTLQLTWIVLFQKKLRKDKLNRTITYLKKFEAIINNLQNQKAPGTDRYILLIPSV